MIGRASNDRGMGWVCDSGTRTSRELAEDAGDGGFSSVNTGTRGEYKCGLHHQS